MIYRTEFYEISSIDSITTISTSEILPDLSISEFVTSEVLAIAHKYLPAYRQVYSSPDASVEDLLLGDFYQIRYLLPRIGTEITVVLEFCHPVSFTDIADEDYATLERTQGIIKLAYDQEHKRFMRQ